MTTLDIHPEFSKLTDTCAVLREELLSLSLEREQLCMTVIPNLKVEYQIKIGIKEYELFCARSELQRIRRTIELMQAAFNRMETITQSQIDCALDAEFTEWQQKMEQMARDIEHAQQHHALPCLSPEQQQQIQKLFRLIAKQLHPDLNPELDEKGKQLWQRACSAYQNGDLNGLQAVQFMIEGVADAPLPTALDELKEVVADLKQRITTTLSVIAALKMQFPLNLAQEIMDVAWLSTKQGELETMIVQAHEQKAAFSLILAGMKGGVFHAESAATH